MDWRWSKYWRARADHRIHQRWMDWRFSTSAPFNESSAATHGCTGVTKAINNLRFAMPNLVTRRKKTVGRRHVAREAQVRLINNKACLSHPRLLWIPVTTTPVTSGGGAGRDTSPHQAKEDDQRRSRRQLGLPPEHGLLPEKHPPQKEPRLNPVNPLNSVEHRATTPGTSWNSSSSARTWVINQESVLRTREDFKGSLLRTFSSVVRKERAERQLHSLFQLPNESVAVFVEEMQHLLAGTLSDVIRQEVQQALGTAPLVAQNQEPEWAPRGPQIMSYAAAVRNPVRPANRRTHHCYAHKQTATDLLPKELSLECPTFGGLTTTARCGATAAAAVSPRRACGQV
ncbi:hypothetical protein HPB50_009994 [Hyalomma asiaticum]|uniref:Uncharacterized protein n=1 Tax=Hyalomma asiaticum TaxID=266040 RepID=A0ACB7S1M8_HYAAI|nr:hypothetical protein HPB50_009994 [Hyalomma asiaticum]